MPPSRHQIEQEILILQMEADLYADIAKLAANPVWSSIVKVLERQEQHLLTAAMPKPQPGMSEMQFHYDIGNNAGFVAGVRFFRDIPRKTAEKIGEIGKQIEKLQKQLQKTMDPKVWGYVPETHQGGE